jgi:hypothetical protein
VARESFNLSFILVRKNGMVPIKPKIQVYSRYKIMRYSKMEGKKNVEYANAYTFFWSENPKLVQQIIRKIAPDIKCSWLQFKYEGKTVTFSLSDQAIADYKPKVQEYSSFGSAVRMLGAYEGYVRKIFAVSYQDIPPKMTAFRNKHKRYIHNTKSFIKFEVGRGIDFFHEVFKYNPHPHTNRHWNFSFN